MFEKWKKLLGNHSEPQKMKPLHYFIVLLGVGLAFMIFTDFLAIEPDRPPDGGLQSTTMLPEDQQSSPAIGRNLENDVIQQYENMYASQLEEILETVVGVGKVEVMVNLDSTPEIVIEKDRDTRSATTQETDKNNATRNQSDQSRNEKVVIIQGKQEQPVVVKTLKPKVRGVLVVAKGADNIQVKAWITEAVQKVLEVPSYKISILPKKG